MVAAARRHERVVQVGTQRRSSPLYHALAHASKAMSLEKSVWLGLID
jgi:hypothetical protein